jgi:phage terminase large subunit-like protein
MQLTDLIRTLPGYDPYRDADGFYFDEAEALYYIGLIEDHCTHIEGDVAGEPYILQEHEAAIVANIFGWREKSTGLRRYRKVFLYYPRKNSKSTFAACLIIAILFGDTEPRMQLFSTGAEVDQAKIIHGIVKGMVEANADLAERAKIYRSQSVIELKADKSMYKALSGRITGKHGKNTYVLAADELHEYPNDILLSAIESSMGTRKQPLSIYTTTADYCRESICNTMYEEAKKYRDGIIVNPQFLPVIFELTREELEADPECWKDEAVWARVNPLYGKSVQPEFLRSELQKALDRPSYENNFKRLYLNLQTESDVRWFTMQKWDACPGEVLDLKGKECWGGLDLATVFDIAAFVLVFHRKGGGYDTLCRFWVPEENARERELKDRVPYTQWIREGWLTATPGNVTDYDYIRKEINALYKIYNIKEIAVDRWNSTQLQNQIMADGIEVYQFGQGYASMSAPAKELERLIVNGQLNHGGNPVLRWMASNVMIEMDAAGNIKPSKSKSSEKIDGIVSLIMAIGRAMLQEQRPSVYAERGAIEL